MKPQPMQPIVFDRHLVIRFQGNAIVRALLDAAREGRKMDMNTIAIGGYSAADQEQFAQLVGYSVSGFRDLGYARRKTVREADAIADALLNSRKKKPAKKKDATPSKRGAR